MGNSVKGNKNKLSLEKGVFTTCKKRNGKCPPWHIKAGKIEHDKVKKIIIVLGYQNKQLKKVINKNKKNIFITNKKFKSGMSSSIKTGLKKISIKDKGFIIIQSDMPFIKTSDINKIYNSILKKKHLVHALKFKNKVGNPIGFDISILSKFRKIKGDTGAKFMVKRLKNNTNFIRVLSDKIFKDFDYKKDFS